MGRGKSQAVLDRLEMERAILEEIQPASVRAVCYQMFVRRLIPSMAKKYTNTVSNDLVYAREAGYIPWEWISDKTRVKATVPTWRNPESILRVAANAYRKDRWALQPKRVEIWSEKDTVAGMLEPVLDRYAVSFPPFRGFSSATRIHLEAVMSRADERPLIVFYLGDHDPDGLYMSTADLPRRLVAYGGRVDFRLLALTAGDVADPDLPSFPASEKAKSTRYDWYVECFGPNARCWELDALDPRRLRDKVARAIRAQIAWPAWKRGAVAEAAEQASLRQVLESWSSISGLAKE